MGINSSPRIRTVHIGSHRISTHGLSHNFWTDIYHLSMTASWPRFTAVCVAIYVFLNVLFAGLYFLDPASVTAARPGNFGDILFFSIETLSTVGYGDMYPGNAYGRVIAAIEIGTGLAFFALLTGIIFSRFAKPRAHVIFAKNPVMGVHDGKKVLMVRLANARHNDISDADAKLWLVRVERTSEGLRFRRFHRLALAQNENPIFMLSWTLIHVIDETSPLHNVPEAELKKMKAHLVVMVTGLDENSSQEVHVRHLYVPADIRVNHRYVDMIDSEDDSHTHINYEKFHETIPLPEK